MKYILSSLLVFTSLCSWATPEPKRASLCERVLAKTKGPLPPGYSDTARAALANRAMQSFVQRMMNIKGPDAGVYWIAVSPEDEWMTQFTNQTAKQVIVTRPDLIAAALKSPHLIDRTYGGPSLTTKAGADSILLLSDSDKASAAKWELAHKALAPFFRPRYLEDVVGPVVRENAETLVNKWLRKRGAITVNSDLEFYALNNVFAPLFEQPLTDPLATELAENLQTFFYPSSKDEAKAARKGFEELVKPSVALAMRGKGAPLLKQLRLVQKENGLPKSWIYDQLITLYFAGQVTTKVMLTMSLYHLTEHPQYQQRIRQEYLDYRAGKGSLKFTRQFVQETLRLYPPVPILHRWSTARVRLGDYIIPKETPVVLNLYAGFIRAETWGEKPLEFRPERFETQNIGRYDLCVFGYGPRICIGQNLALQEAELLLGELVSRAQIERKGEFAAPVLENAGLIHVTNPLRLKLTPN